MLKLYQVAGIILLCILIAVLTFNITLSWFVDESITSNGKPDILVVGTVDLDVRTNFNFYNLVLAPDTIYKNNVEGGKTVDYGTYVSTTSESDTGNIFVRAKFATDRPELTLHFDNNNWIKSDETETINGLTYDFYYYLGSVGLTKVVFNSGYKVDNTLDNSKANADVKISFIFEGIQSQYGAHTALWPNSPTAFKNYVNSLSS
jgi:hypothetical protein